MIQELDKLEVVTLFVEDLDPAKAFYRDVFGLELIFEDAGSAVFRFGELLINLLVLAEAPTLVTPRSIATRDGGARALYTIRVPDADKVCAELVQHGVSILNGPQDRPWGRRTASFADPAGNVWEIAEELASRPRVRE